MPAPGRLGAFGDDDVLVSGVQPGQMIDAAQPQVAGSNGPGCGRSPRRTLQRMWSTSARRSKRASWLDPACRREFRAVQIKVTACPAAKELALPREGQCPAMEGVVLLGFDAGDRVDQDQVGAAREAEDGRDHSWCQLVVTVCGLRTATPVKALARSARAAYPNAMCGSERTLESWAEIRLGMVAPL
jgi:hypothetical protein